MAPEGPPRRTGTRMNAIRTPSFSKASSTTASQSMTDEVELEHANFSSALRTFECCWFDGIAQPQGCVGGAAATRRAAARSLPSTAAIQRLAAHHHLLLLPLYLILPAKQNLFSSLLTHAYKPSRLSHTHTHVTKANLSLVTAHSLTTRPPRAS